jgi:putative DNA primase/helicase
VSSYLGGADSHKNAEVRGVLEPVREFAERLRVAVLSITHFSKTAAGSTTKALHRFIGSIAFVGAPRIALAVIEEPETDRRLLLHAKNNLAPPPAGLAYRIREKVVGPAGAAVAAPYVAWDDQHVTMTPMRRWRPTPTRSEAPPLPKQRTSSRSSWPMVLYHSRTLGPPQRPLESPGRR